MRMIPQVALLSFLASSFVVAALEPHSIPRTSRNSFKSEGLFEGGADRRANLENLRLADHAGFERWVIDFSDEKKQLAKLAPKFQIRYIRAEKIPLPDGTDIVRRPARFVFVFRSIQKNLIQAKQIKNLLKRSHFVKDIVLYPPIEEGDTAMEFILKDNVLFEPHQPIQNEGRLVLDLKRGKTTEID